MTRYFWRVVFLVVCSLTCAVGQVKTLTITCAPDPACVPNHDQMCIDANTGKTTKEPTLSVEKREGVAVTVYNENPFAYDYNLAGNLTKVDDADLSGFLGILVPGLGVAKATKEDLAKNAPVLGLMAATAKPLLEAHPGGNTPNDELTTFLSQVQEFANAVTGQFKSYQDLANSYSGLANGVYSATCPQLQQRVNDLYSHMWNTVNSISQTHDRLRNEIDSLKSNFDEVNGDIDAAVQSQTSATQKALVSGGHDAEEAFSSLQGTQKLQTSIAREKTLLLDLECQYAGFIKQQVIGELCPRVKKLETVTSDGTNFWQQKFFSSGDEPGDVSVTLSRTRLPSPTSLQPLPSASSQSCSKDLLAKGDVPDFSQCFAADGGQRDGSTGGSASQNGNKGTKNTGGQQQSGDSSAKSETVSTAIIHFGGARFITAAGLTFGMLSNPQYASVTGIPLDSSGKPTSTTFTSVAGLKGESQVRFVPSAYLHTRLVRGLLSNEGFYATFGVGVHADSTGTTPEYLAGISHSFADQRFFLTAGAYIGQQQELKNGLYLGQDVSSVTGDLPVSNHTKVRFGLAISYRFDLGGGSKDNNKSQDKSNSQQ